ncbi:hypothetical protein [Rhizobium sp. P28RR-XV]|uniref:hypothetical protein n=1 Tax=Rhizobium sp. P28RR-XV TaxID=2726737 RepID=UPI00145781CF|nr:hypothetical protein [Rhizobium sp. P28RR-XV]NLR89461.1 hypothetical protein [Rhizobium sp. P28RR-XV]
MSAPIYYLVAATPNQDKFAQTYIIPSTLDTILSKLMTYVGASTQLQFVAKNFGLASTTTVIVDIKHLDDDFHPLRVDRILVEAGSPA